MDGDEAHWINSTDYPRDRGAAGAVRGAARRGLARRSRRPSCSRRSPTRAITCAVPGVVLGARAARAGVPRRSTTSRTAARQDARAQVDAEQRTLEDYVFARARLHAEQDVLLGLVDGGDVRHHHGSRPLPTRPPPTHAHVCTAPVVFQAAGRRLQAVGGLRGVDRARRRVEGVERGRGLRREDITTDSRRVGAGDAVDCARCSSVARGYELGPTMMDVPLTLDWIADRAERWMRHGRGGVAAARQEPDADDVRQRDRAGAAARARARRCGHQARRSRRDADVEPRRAPRGVLRDSARRRDASTR